MWYIKVIGFIILMVVILYYALRYLTSKSFVVHKSLWVILCFPHFKCLLQNLTAKCNLSFYLNNMVTFGANITFLFYINNVIENVFIIRSVG